MSVSGGLSLRAFAKSIGVSDTAVRKAIKAGRLGDAVGQDAAGVPRILDPEAATERWHQTTRTGAGVRDRHPSSRALAPHVEAGSLVDAQRMATSERARKLKLENDAREGRLVPVDKVKREAFDAMRLVRDSLLNIPSRIAGELAAETDAAVVFRKLDAAIREALASTADALTATVH